MNLKELAEAFDSTRCLTNPVTLEYKDGLKVEIVHRQDLASSLWIAKLFCVPERENWSLPAEEWLSFVVLEPHSETVKQVKVIIEDAFDSKTFDTMQEDYHDFLLGFGNLVNLPMLDRFGWL